MLRGELKSGFKFEIDPEQINDMEFIDALEEMEENNLKFSKVVRMLLGTEQRARLYDHVRVNGKVPPQAITDAISEIFDICENELKNS